MYTDQLIFSQVTDHLSMYTFHYRIQCYQCERYVKRFRCLDQYLEKAFAQLTYRESLRDIEAYLRAHQNKFHHMWIRSKNAVMTQIWIAICVYLLLVYLKFASKISRNLQQILRLLQLNLFERCDLQILLHGDPPETKLSHLQTTLPFS